jgi:hypothetical protein
MHHRDYLTSVFEWVKNKDDVVIVVSRRVQIELDGLRRGCHSSEANSALCFLEDSTVDLNSCRKAILIDNEPVSIA